MAVMETQFASTLLTFCCFLLAVTTAQVPVVIQVATSEPGGASVSLQELLCNGERPLSSGTTLQLDTGSHMIADTSSCVVEDLSDLTITSSEGATIQCQSQDTAGSNFMFFNITNLTLSNLRVENCGRVVPQDLPSYVNNTFIYIDQEQKAVFVLSLVTNLQLVNVTVTQSFGFSIIGINLQGNTELRGVTISDTDNFRHPSCDLRTIGVSLGCSGSGISLVYSDPSNENNLNSSYTHTSFTVSDSNFVSNVNFVPRDIVVPIYYNLRAGYELQPLPLTGTPGICMYFGQRTYRVSVTITTTVFSRNGGYIGALAIVLSNTFRNTRIEVEDCVFEENQSIQLSARGGAIAVYAVNFFPDLFSIPILHQGTHNLLHVRNSLFVNNSANNGGAVYFFFTPQNVSEYSLVFDNVTFYRNCAPVGTVFQVETRPATFITNNYHILLVDVTAIDNVLPSSVFNAISSESTASFVFNNVFNVTLRGRNHTHGTEISRNIPGGLLVVGGNLFLQGKVVFSNNTSQNGGAIGLLSSLMFAFEGSRITFSNNKATLLGGAIHAYSPVTETVATCIFQVIGPNRETLNNFDRFDLRIEFISNSAEEGGNSLFAAPFYICASLPESSISDLSIILNATRLHTLLFEFSSPVNNSLSEITSQPERICLCGDSTYPTYDCQTTMNDSVVIFPGQEFSLRVFPVDLGFNPISSILFAHLDSHMHRLGNGQATIQLKAGECTTVKLNIFGPAGSTILFLSAQNGDFLSQIDVIIQDCPPGFLRMEQTNGISCICDPFIEELQKSCNTTTFTVNRQRGEWLDHGKNTSDLFFVRSCPIGFCNQTATSVDLSKPNYLCLPGHVGVLCGACAENLSSVFGTDECRRCTNYSLFTIPVFALIGLLIVVILFSSNFTVTQGYLISIVFYTNLVGINFDIFFNFERQTFVWLWTSWLNLELGFPLCFYDGMTQIGKSSLQCIFPVYLLLIAIGIIVVSQRSRLVAKLTFCHGIQVLATIVYLSFNKMLRYIIEITILASLTGRNGVTRIWWRDGNIEYFTGLHGLIVIVPAAVTSVFIISYMLMVVFIRQIEQLTSKFKPFLDACGGPFKDQFRFWFGLRLVVLTVLCIVYASLGADNPSSAIKIQQTILVLLMILQAYFQPFRDKLINTLDLLLMLNLYLAFLAVEDMRSSTQDIFVTSLVGFGLILSILYVLCHVYKFPKVHTKLHPHVEKLQQLQWSTITSTCTLKCGRGKRVGSVEGERGSGGVGRSVTTSTIVSLRTAEDADNTTPRSPRFSQLREPSIEDDTAI